MSNPNSSTSSNSSLDALEAAVRKARKQVHQWCGSAKSQDELQAAAEALGAARERSAIREAVLALAVPFYYTNNVVIGDVLAAIDARTP